MRLFFLLLSLTFTLTGYAFEVETECLAMNQTQGKKAAVEVVKTKQAKSVVPQ